MSDTNKYTKWLISVLLVFAVFATTGRGEEIGADIRSITVLPPADVTGLNVVTPFQQHIGEYLYGTRQYVVQYSAYSIPGFTAKDLQQTFERLDSQLILYSYVEPQRLSLFLFDSNRPQEFVTASVPYAATDTTVLTQQLILNTFPAAFDALMNAFYQGQYQPLPGAQVAENKYAGDEKGLTRELFRELASMKSSSTYAGANFGIARMAANGAAGSTVNLSVYAGYSLNTDIALQLTLDVFTHLMPSARINYKLPFFSDKLVSLHANFGAGMILGTVAEHRGFPSQNLTTGGILFGPGLGLYIPLAGADVRLDFRFLLGSGSVFLGTYGLTYYL
ncbi:MAG: hypothetical protein R3B54_13240 [Bdellovibrionota bacterium]